MDSPPTPLPTSSDGPGTNSPPTSLAVIVFAGVFAVLAVFFVGGFLIACIRARNNPERYGPRPAMPGRAKQTRKKGLAMAVLESIPIIRFGNNNKSTDGAIQKDIELGSGGLTVDDGSTAARGSLQVESSAEPSAKTNETSSGDTDPSKNAVESESGGLECSICIADFVESEEVRVLPCNHRFHPACIDPWLLNISGTCPICRYDLQPDSPNASDTVDPPEAEFHPERSPIPYVRAQALAHPASSPTTLAVPSPTLPETRDGSTIRSRLREIRHAAHTGPEYISALRRLYHDHERRPSTETRRPRSSSRTVNVAPEETRPS